ncbi:MAG: 2-oxoglutarate dehydrogenase complex dihydrolipoyllysine-residue succinyltransferase [Chloroflexi bacterium]|nr:2-oxoglutarate dehydrogenase complex dihydrolipoyllysine-residue succinyltransferase [Chloroflexota bacterium]
MAVEIKVPDMGESVIEATVAQWLKQEGEPVAAGEPVVELETDKINLEVGAPQAGILQRIEKQAGENVSVGEVLAFVSADEEAPPAAAPAAPGAAGKEQAGESKDEAAGEAPPEEKESSGTSRITPVAQRMAQEEGIDLSQVTPSGSGGRITKQDIEAYLEKGPSVTKPASAATPASAAPAPSAAPPAPAPETRPAAPPAAQSAVPPAAPPLARDGRETRERMTRRRQTIAHRLVEAQQTAAMLTTFNEIDMSAVMDLRKRRREGFKERYGVDLGFMSFFVKAVVAALKSFPYLNAEIQNDEIIVKHYYDIGIAIGAEEGLVVPVVRNADRLNFAEIERSIRSLVAKTQEGTLSLDDLRGGTFTITNGGVYGSLLSTPILNPPQVGILGMHAIKERPVVVDGEITIRPMMYVALSYDHRIVDGREAVQFLVRVKELVEDPETLLFG